MMTLSKQWHKLRQQTSRHDEAGYRLSPMSSADHMRVYAAVTEQGLHAALVVELVASAANRQLANASGGAFDVLVGDFPGLSPGRQGVAIVLNHEDFEDLFEHLGHDLLDAIANAGRERIAACMVQCIDRWRQFIEQGRPMLSDMAVRGLTGELTVLGRCIGRLGASAAVEAWMGPLRSLRDFQLPNVSVEVKTWESDTGGSLHFNDPQQLDADQDRPVMVAAVRLALVESKGLTLPHVVAHLKTRLTDNPHALASFESKLGQYGYIEAHADQLIKQFAIGPMLVFEVRQSFPRIRPSDVMPGVENVQFNVSLASLRPFLIDADEVLGAADSQIERGE